MNGTIQSSDIILSKEDGCPDMFCNPFMADKVNSIDICISKRFMIIQQGHPIKATVRMENNNTCGQQCFFGDNLMSVMKQIDAFLRSIE